jgi:nucleotide-binding universal stress UspA family protein
MSIPEIGSSKDRICRAMTFGRIPSAGSSDIPPLNEQNLAINRTVSTMRIFHPTDLGSGSATAFLHALRLAVDTRSTITIMHVASHEGDTEWSEMPGVRSTLSKWGLVQGEHDMEGLKRLGVSVRKVIVDGADPVANSLKHLTKHPTDLVVLATHQRDGGFGWFKRKVAEPIARGAAEPTLFVPYDRKGFLNGTSGVVSLRKVLVPVASDPPPVKALALFAKLAAAMGQSQGVLTLLHVGDDTSRPAVDTPTIPGWTVEQVVRQGEVVDTIVETATATQSDLLVMATKGHEGFLDALRGSNTEQVLRAVPCPVLAVPA